MSAKVLGACLAAFILVSSLGFYYLANYESSRLRQKYYEDAYNISHIVRSQFFEVYRDIEDANVFISELANELVHIADVDHIEVYDRFGRLRTQVSLNKTRRPEDYALHRGYASKVMESGRSLSMEHVAEGVFEVVAPLFMAGDEHGGNPIGAVTVGISMKKREEGSLQRAEALVEVIQLAVGRSASHLEIERLYIDSITRRLGMIKGLASLIVYDNDLKVIAHSEAGHLGEDAPEAVAVNLRQVMSSREESEMSASEGDRLNKYMPIVLSGEDGEDYVAAVVEFSLDMTYIDDTVQGMKDKMFVVALCIMASTVLAIWFVLKVVVVRPVSSLSAMTLSIAAGNLDSKVETHSDDELGRLARSFNKMTEELRQSRDELVSARNFNEDVLSSLNECLLVVSNEGHVMMANDAASELLGYSKDELLKSHVSKFIAGWEEVLIEVRSRGLAVFSEKTFERKNGLNVPVVLSASEMSSQSLGVIFGYVMVATDISERKSAEEALMQYTRKLETYTAELVETDQKMRESEERFRLAFETGPDPIMLTRVRDGKYVDVNYGFVSMTGYTKESVIGRGSYDEVSLWVNRDERDEFLMRIEREGSIRDFPARIAIKNGSVKDCLASASVFDLGGEPHLLLLLRDMTELIKAQRERDMLTGQVMEKNRELEQLIYVSSHDLRSPLVNVQGFSKEVEMDFQEVSSIVRDAPVDEEKKQRLEDLIGKDIPVAVGYIKSSIAQMDVQLNGLLKLARLGRADVNIEVLEMDALMDDVLDNFGFRIKEDDVKIDRSALPMCMGDYSLVFQGVSNIVDNALKYMERTRKCVITISGWIENSRVVYCIRDNGKGIRKEYQEKVFEIFHRLEPGTTTGEGLGLSIVQKAISKSGGKVWLESEEGKGSRFYLSLPLA